MHNKTTQFVQTASSTPLGSTKAEPDGPNGFVWLVFYPNNLYYQWSLCLGMPN